MNSVRHSNFELFHILTMLVVVAYHAALCLGIAVTSPNQIAAYLQHEGGPCVFRWRFWGLSWRLDYSQGFFVMIMIFVFTAILFFDWF